MIKHKSPISGIDAFGGWVATAGYDNQVILWDTASGHALARGFHDHLVNQCRFSPCGKYLVSAGSDSTARLWKVPEMKLIGIMTGHEDDVEMASFGPDGMRLATASRDHCVRIYNLNGYIQKKLAGHSADVISVEWENSGETLVSSSDDGTVRKWSAATGQQIDEIDMGGIETDTLIIVNEHLMYSGNDSGDLVEIYNGRATNYAAHESGIKRLAYDRKRNLIVSLSYDRRIKIWRIGSANGPEEIAVSRFPPCVWARSCAFSGKSELVFGTFGTTYAKYNYVHDSWDVSRVGDTHGSNAVLETKFGTICVGDSGDVKVSGKIVRRLKNLCNFLLEFDGTIITGGQSGEVFNALSGEVIFQHKSPLNCGASFSKAGVPYCIIGTYTGDGIVLYKNEIRDIRVEKVVKLHENAVKSISSNGNLIFSVCANTDAAYHRISDFTCVKMIRKAHTKIANGCTAMADGRFVSVSRDLKLRFFDGDKMSSITTPHTHSIKCISSSRDGRYLACGSYNGDVSVYDTMNERWLRKTRPTACGISSVCHAKNGFLASSYDGNIYEINPGDL